MKNKTHFSIVGVKIKATTLTFDITIQNASVEDFLFTIASVSAIE